MANGQFFVDRIKKAWDDGDAVFPLEQNLPSARRNVVLAATKPTIVATELGDTRISGTFVESGDAVVMCTSGTTGQPKAVILTHTAIAASAVATSRRLGVTASDTWFACLPPSHIGGFSVILRSLVIGTPLITSPQFTVDSYNDAAKRGATLVSLVPTALQRIDASLFRKILLGGARPPIDRPPQCVATYGLTETGSGIVYDSIPLDGIEIEIRGGVVYVRGPMLLRGYRDGVVPLDPQGWFRTGDRGSIDEHGKLTVDGREGDLIITGGENVWPELVEQVLIHHPHIVDVCVAGVTDKKWGQSVHAWIVSDQESISLEEVRDFVKQSLPAYCAPQHVHFTTAIPRTSLGKPQRHTLVSLLPS